MKVTKVGFEYQVYENAAELLPDDARLLAIAQNIAQKAYAPYSGFLVGAAALLHNGEILTGTNQENASFPAGICAERVLLSAISSLYPQIPVSTIAISYLHSEGKSNHPITPCGICRQSLTEYENRMQQPIRLLLAGLAGPIFLIPACNQLLPLGFSGTDLQ